MNTHPSVPAAVRICHRCGELAEGESCHACAKTIESARYFAASVIARGVSGFRVRRRDNQSKRTVLWADMAEAEFRRLRLAQMNAGIPARRIPDRPQAAVYATWRETGRKLFWPVAFLLAFAALVVLLLSGAF